MLRFAQQIANPFLPLLVIRQHGGAGQIGIVFGASALLGALLSPLAGAAGDRHGFRPMLAGACVLAAASLDRWLEASDKIAQYFYKADSVNLDRKQTVLGSFLALQSAMR